MTHNKVKVVKRGEVKPQNIKASQPAERRDWLKETLADIEARKRAEIQAFFGKPAIQEFQIGG